MMGKLHDQVCVITGGGSGVGLAIASTFAAEQARVVIAGRDAAKLEAAASGLACDFQICDVADAEQCRRLIESVESRYGRVDILVNNAGANIRDRALRELTPDAWDALLRTNLHGAFYCLHAALPGMLARKSGLVLNIVSIAGKRANPLGGAAYIAAKFGMGGLGMCLSNEERESGVRVSNIYPGEIDTPILAHRPKPLTAEHRSVILQPEDVAAAALFVATLPPRASVPELIIKPTVHAYW